MKILIYGAGTIGSIYAAGLHEAGCNITLLARGSHYENLKMNGVIIRDTLTGEITISHIPLTQKLGTADFYDLIIVAVRLNQVASVIPVLKVNTVCPLIMFMLNIPEGVKQLANELDPKHVILGFPGIGGAHRGNLIDYIRINQQKTTIGGVNGHKEPVVRNYAFIKEIKALLERAKFRVAVSTDMEAWLKTHAVFIACIAAAISKENGDSVQLGRKRARVGRMVTSIREGFSACKALGMPIAPTNLRIIFMAMPRWFSVLYWQHALKGKVGTLAIAPHANAAKEEMQLLAKKVLTMVHSSSIPTPTLDSLLSSFI